MRIGIICEGPSDAAVIVNILKGATGLDTSNFIPIVPVVDNTTKAHLNPDTHSSWSVVINECKEKKKIRPFFSQSDSSHLVIHLDTAEAKEYGINIPENDDKEYCSKLRTEVIRKIETLLGDEYKDITLYAIAIQEIDAWVLTIYQKQENCLIRDPKKEFQRSLKKQGTKYGVGYKNYSIYSDDFRNSNKTKKNGYLSSNCSLRWFWEEAENKFAEL
jgi:hypothetical protein